MAGTPQHWKAVSLQVPSSHEDLLIGLLSGRVLGIEVRPGSPGNTVLELFLRAEEDLEALRQLAKGALERLDPACDSLDLQVRTVNDGRWVERYQESLRRFDVGVRFTIDPAGAGEEVADGRILIRLVPGRAFGTGEHETTRLCLETLEEAVEVGARWLDLGCGSGILAVAAASLGAEEVVALDLDRDAVDVTRETAVANWVGDRVHAEQGSWDRAGDEPFHGIVANIHAPFFLEHAAVVRALLQPGGVLICTGFLEGDRPAITAALQEAGLAVREVRSLGEWVMIRGEAAP